EHDHIDVFPTHADVKRAFARFASGIVRGGWLVACADEPGAAELAARGDDLAGRQVVTYGTAPQAGYRVVELVQRADGVSFDLAGPFGTPVPVSLRLAGAHNARNAAGALAAADAVGVPATAAAKSFATFSGTERRLEELGSERGLADHARPGDLVLVLGAGDIRPAGIRLLELLRERAPV